MVWDREKIKSILPHRDPFLFIDEVTEVDGADRIVAVRLVKEDEIYFRGHFPGRPVMPGVLIIEAMAQASILLYYICKPEIAMENPEYYLGKVKSEMLHPVFPGDRLFIEIINVKITDSAGVVDAIARVGDNTVAKANLIFGIKRK